MSFWGSVEVKQSAAYIFLIVSATGICHAVGTGRVSNWHHPGQPDPSVCEGLSMVLQVS